MGRCTFGWCFSSRSRSPASTLAATYPAQQVSLVHTEEQISNPATLNAFRRSTSPSKDSVVQLNSTEAIDPAHEVTTCTQPLPSVTEPLRVILRSISTSDTTQRDDSFSRSTATFDADISLPTPPQASPGDAACSCTCGSTAPLSRASHASIPKVPTSHTLNLRTCFAGAAAARGSVGVLNGPADLLGVDDGLNDSTTKDLTLDGTSDHVGTVLWPDCQVAASGDSDNGGMPASGGSSATCSTWDAQLANNFAPTAGSRPQSAAVQQFGTTAAAAAVAVGLSGSGGERLAFSVAAPSLPVTQGALLNPSQVRDRIQELEVLHIRPGAALLLGKATASGQSVVARFERGCPTALLAPQLLSALQEGRCRAHPHVVTLLEVHAVALPAQVLEAGLPTAAVAAPYPLRGGSGGGGHAGCEASLWESLDGDLATAARALQQAEAVRGARQCGSGLIGGMLTGGSTAAVTGTGRMLHALGVTQMRLHETTGHLRASGGCGGSSSCGSLSFSKPLLPPRLLLPPGLGTAAAPPPSKLQASTQQSNSSAADAALVTMSIMELCDGGTLYDEARSGVFKCCLPDVRCLCDPQYLRRLELFISMARHIAHGLHFLHTVCRLSHGDLVSRNVLLQRVLLSDPEASCTTGFVAKLAGYGRLVAAASPQAVTEAAEGAGGSGGEPSNAAAIDTPPHLSTTSLSRVNSVHVGLWRDVHSLAPERLRHPHAPPTFEADVYAYGILLYEMAVGETPWAGLLPACVAVGIMTGELRIQWPYPPGFGSHGGALLPCIATLVERCTALVPEDRPSVDEILTALDEANEEARSFQGLAELHRQQRCDEQLFRAFLNSSSSSLSSSPIRSRSTGGGRGRGGNGNGSSLSDGFFP